MKKDNDLQSVMMKTWKDLKGMNAIIALFPKNESFFILKNGSPIVLGKGSNEYFIASDASAIAPHTKNVYFLEDDEILSVDKDSAILIFNGKNKPIPFIKLSYDIAASDLGSYPHFMLKEINEQPKIIENIILSEQKHITKLASKIKKSFGAYLIGCGTASYAGLAGSYLFSKIAKRHINNSIGSEFNYSLDFLKSNSLVIALSQSRNN
jgi:glucosamine--fructose-6-phosphate aminotransferase (isomerizing)